MTPIRYRVVDSPVGPLTIAGDGETVTALRMQDQSHPPAGRDTWIGDESAFVGVVQQLEAYFAGERFRFDVKLELTGTEFQRAVWTALVDIPYGCTASYGEIATAVGRPKACRAVGLANGRNPVAIIVPCHRVIGASGSLTGYGGGLERKTMLLNLESAHAPRPAQGMNRPVLAS